MRLFSEASVRSLFENHKTLLSTFSATKVDKKSEKSKAHVCINCTAYLRERNLDSNTLHFSFSYKANVFYDQRYEFLYQFIVFISGKRCVVSHQMMEHLSDLGQLTGV